MKFEDRRSKKIVFVSHCIINCNNKFPGYADVAGAYTDFVIPILEAGIGIFQMPCCEALGWGGVGREHIEFDLDRENLDQTWIQEYPKLCAWWANWTADRFEDYVVNGYKIPAIIHVQDSPTCGLDHVDPFPQVHFDLLDQGMTWDDLVFEHLIAGLETPEEMAARGASGSGAFGSILRNELRGRGLEVQWLGYVPSKPMEEQSHRILNALGIRAPNEGHNMGKSCL
jgi:predicted secreted protein